MRPGNNVAARMASYTCTMTRWGLQGTLSRGGWARDPRRREPIPTRLTRELSQTIGPVGSKKRASQRYSGPVASVGVTRRDTAVRSTDWARLRFSIAGPSRAMPSRGRTVPVTRPGSHEDRPGSPPKDWNAASTRSVTSTASLPDGLGDIIAWGGWSETSWVTTAEAGSWDGRVATAQGSRWPPREIIDTCKRQGA